MLGFHDVTVWSGDGGGGLGEKHISTLQLNQGKAYTIERPNLQSKDSMNKFIAWSGEGTNRSGNYLKFENITGATALIRAHSPARTDVHRQWFSEGKVHGIEVAGAHIYEQQALQIALDYDLAILGNSDIHGLIDWDYAAPAHGAFAGSSHRTATLVLAEAATSDAIKKALFKKATAAIYQNTLIGRKEELTAIINGALSIKVGPISKDNSYAGIYAYYVPEVRQIEFINTAPIDFVIKDFNDAMWGTSSLFETGSCSLIEAHAIQDVLERVKRILDLEEIGYYPNNWQRKVK